MVEIQHLALLRQTVEEEALQTPALLTLVIMVALVEVGVVTLIKLLEQEILHQLHQAKEVMAALATIGAVAVEVLLPLVVLEILHQILARVEMAQLPASQVAQ
jgi:hypothetical protein